jgi:WD40 repeat protein
LSDKQSIVPAVHGVTHCFRAFAPAPGGLVRNGRRIATVVTVAATLAATAGCRGRKALGGPSYDGGLSDLSIGLDGPPGTADATAPDGGAPSDGPASTDVPRPVDPQISRAWTWQPCGTIASEAADLGAVFGRQGDIVVLGAPGVRVYDASGALRAVSSESASFLVSAPDGAPLIGTIEPSGIVLRSIASPAVRFTFAPAPIATCGRKFAFSVDGDHLFSLGGETTCVWRTSTQSFVGSVATARVPTGVPASAMVAVRRDEVITLEELGSTTDVVTRDFTGRERARVRLARTGPAFLSAAGDRLVMTGTLWDLERMIAVPWTANPSNFWSPTPAFTPAGDLVLFGDGLFRTADGARLQTVSDTSRLARADEGTVVLSPDGRRAVSMEFGRATLMDVPSLGIAAVLGPPSLPEATRPTPPINHLALSRDGSLLVSNAWAFAAFAFNLAPQFADSKVIWSASLEINLEVDVSADGKTVAIAGDGRALYGGVDGRIVWPSPPPPAAVGPDICLPVRLRFSPKMTFLAGNNYSRVLDVFDVRDVSRGTAPVPLVHLPAGCDAVAFSRDERLMATSGAALYRTAPNPDGWLKLWSAAVPAPPRDNFTVDGLANDVSFSPDETQLLVSRCTQTSCLVNLLGVETGAILRALPELQAPHPSFSPDGSWIVAGGTLLHLSSGDVRELDPAVATTTALFAPDGDIIAGSADDVLTRYCRSR